MDLLLRRIERIEKCLKNKQENNISILTRIDNINNKLNSFIAKNNKQNDFLNDLIQNQSLDVVYSYYKDENIDDLENGNHNNNNNKNKNTENTNLIKKVSKITANSIILEEFSYNINIINEKKDLFNKNLSSGILGDREATNIISMYKLSYNFNHLFKLFKKLSDIEKLIINKYVLQTMKVFTIWFQYYVNRSNLLWSQLVDVEDK